MSQKDFARQQLSCCAGGNAAVGLSSRSRISVTATLRLACLLDHGIAEWNEITHHRTLNVQVVICMKHRRNILEVEDRPLSQCKCQLVPNRPVRKIGIMHM